MMKINDSYLSDEQKVRVIMGCKEQEDRLREYNINEELIEKIMKEYAKRFIFILYQNK